MADKIEGYELARSARLTLSAAAVIFSNVLVLSHFVQLPAVIVLASVPVCLCSVSVIAASKLSIWKKI